MIVYWIRIRTRFYLRISIPTPCPNRPKTLELKLTVLRGRKRPPHVCILQVQPLHWVKATHQQPYCRLLDKYDAVSLRFNLVRRLCWVVAPGVEACFHTWRREKEPLSTKPPKVAAKNLDLLGFVCP